MNKRALNFFAELKDSAQERDFQQRVLPSNRRFVYFGALIMSLSWIGFIQNDFIIYGHTLAAYLFLLLRLSQVGVGIAVSLIIRKNDDTKLYEKLVFAFWMSHLLSIFFVDAVRPGVFWLHIIVDLLALVLSYIMIPSRLRLQLIPAMIFTILSISRIIITVPEDYLLERSGIIVIYTMTNLIGIIMSWQRNTDRRKRYLVMNELQKSNHDLKNALAEIKTLQGIIPICASCKKIRDDHGYWNQLEEYMRTRIDAEFSHSICPDCMEDLYPEIAAKIAQKKSDH